MASQDTQLCALIYTPDVSSNSATTPHVCVPTSSSSSLEQTQLDNLPSPQYPRQTHPATSKEKNKRKNLTSTSWECRKLKPLQKQSCSNIAFHLLAQTTAFSSSWGLGQNPQACSSNPLGPHPSTGSMGP